MRAFSAALILIVASSVAQAAALTSKWVLHYDSNDGEGLVGDTLRLFGHPLPASPESYTAPPFGPIILSFVHPQTGRPAAVDEVSFSIYYPFQRTDYPRRVPIRFLDSQGGILATHVPRARK